MPVRLEQLVIPVILLMLTAFMTILGTGLTVWKAQGEIIIRLDTMSREQSIISAQLFAIQQTTIKNSTRIEELRAVRMKEASN